MFSGIIQSLGQVARIHRSEGRAEVTVRTGDDFTGFELGESIAVNGVCLTVRAAESNRFTVDLSGETLDRTGFKEIREGEALNLERSLTRSQKVSGHFVSGHVDQVGTVVSIESRPGETLFRFEHPPELAPLIVEKGSVAVDGISLTAFACEGNRFTVSIIPFTLMHTNLKDRKIGDRVNIECDIIGKYVLKACETILGTSRGDSGVSLDSLRKHGFL
ncbi:MAG: riboflavin synthase [Nitrospinaceae bacterium]|nr:MAG: riboflavin synthase [Nitrospinaceae bacterium]